MHDHNNLYWHLSLKLAYQALTDDEARRNWEKYGNPDGPGAMSFGIALPSWIVEKENSVWVRIVLFVCFFLLEWTMKHLFCALFILCRNRYDDFWLLGYVWVDFIRKKNLVAIFNSLRHNISTPLRAIECHWFAKYSGTLFPRIFVVILFAVYFLKDILNKDYYYQSRLWFLQFRLQRCIQKVRI